MSSAPDLATRRLLIFAGHSGGHLFPAQAFAESFRGRFPGSRIELVTSRRARRFTAGMPGGIFDAVHFLPEFPFPSGFSLRWPGFLLKFTESFCRSLFLLLRQRPHLCVGFGSYVSYPGMWLAAKLKIPAMIHEQNFLPGKATRMLARHADLVAVSFEGTFARPGLVRRRVQTGLPIRSAILRAVSTRRSGAGSQDPFRVLVLGGSQGAHRLNELIFKTFLGFTDEEKAGIAVTHIAGHSDVEWLRESYDQAHVRHETCAFHESMHTLYGEADLAITRAGANTLFELALFGVPSVVIPYPHADGHQKANAEYFASRGGLLMQDQHAASPEWLREQIRCLRRDAGARARLSAKISELVLPDAAERLVDLAEELAWKEKTCLLSASI